MTNFEVYKKTLSFSFVLFCIDILSLAVVIGLGVAGFFMMDKSTDKAIIGLVIGLILGVILTALIKIFISNRVKAGQLGIMAKGVADNELPDKPFKAGLEDVKGRFGKITLFFFVTNQIKGIFRQIGRTFTRFGRLVGGNTGESITSVIDSAIQTVIGYLADCCLAWVMYNKEKGAARSACEGAVIFFKHGKTLIRNIGRILGMSLLSLIVIGGAFMGIAYAIFQIDSQLFVPLANEIGEIFIRAEDTAPEFLTNPATLTIIIAALIGLIMQGIIHSVLIRPFILVGVLRNYMAVGLAEKPTEQDYAEIENKIPRFSKLRNKA